MCSIVKQILILIVVICKCDSSPRLLNDLDQPSSSSVNQLNYVAGHGGGGKGGDGVNSVILSNSRESRLTKSVKKNLNTFKYSVTPKWPVTDHQLGQISAVSIDSKGNIVIFHRGSHVWNEKSFNIFTNKYQPIEDGPINISTVLVIEPKTMQSVNGWGADFFFLPHGLTFDTKGNVWLTDVALHQIFKFPAEGSDKPTLVLGERFVPGNDEKHFCKPTSVAIDSRNGDFYVADGYCNSRIARFNSAGVFLNQWGQADTTSSQLLPNFFSIPHKVILAEELNLVCVADREHGRIQCFTPPNGQFAFSITHNEFAGRLFSISYSPYQGGVLFAVNGAFTIKDPVKGFLFNLTTRELLTSFGNFSQPHDIVSTADAKNVYVVEIGPNYLWRFDKEVPIDLTNTLQSSDNQINIDDKSTKLASPLKDSTDALSTNKSRKFFLPKLPLIPTSFSSSNSVIIILILSTIILIILIAFLINRRRDYRPNSYSPLQEIKGWVTGYRSTKNELNLGRILNDPKRSGFNKLAMDDSDNETELINGEIHSESEVEEFNVSSVRKI